MATGLPLPHEVRRAIIRSLHEHGLTYAQIAELLDIGEASVSRVLRLHRETGRIEPGLRGPGRSSAIVGSVARELERLAAKTPDATTAELMAALAKRTGVRTSLSSVKRALHRLGYSRKKRSS